MKVALLFILILQIYEDKLYYLETNNLTFNNSDFPIIYDKWINDSFSLLRVNLDLKISTMPNEIIILSLSDLFDINITISIKNNNFNANNNDLNIIYNPNIYINILFVIVNSQIRVIIINNINIDLSNITNSPNFEYNIPNGIISWNNYKLILGGDKNFNQINYNFNFNNIYFDINNLLGSLTETIIDINSSNLNLSSEEAYWINIQEKSFVKVWLNFTKLIKNSNYIPNKLVNGFSGIINGDTLDNDDNDLIIEEIILSNGFYTQLLLNTKNSHIKLPKQFFEYIFNLDIKTYTIYTSISPIKYNGYPKCYERNFYLYKRNNFFFKLYNHGGYNTLTFSISKNNLSNILRYKYISYGKYFLYYISIINLNDNNYLVKFDISYGDSPNFIKYTREFKETNNFLNNDINLIGFTDTSCSQNLSAYTYVIYEIFLIEGILFRYNNKIYTKNISNSKNIYIECYNTNFSSISNFILSRRENNKDCSNLFTKPYVISNNCLINDSNYNCIYCKYQYFLKNGVCIEIFNTTNLNNLQYFVCKANINNNYNRTFNFNLNLVDGKRNFYYLYLEQQYGIYYSNFRFVINSNTFLKNYAYSTRQNNVLYLNNFISNSGTNNESINSFEFVNTFYMNFRYKFTTCYYKEDQFIPLSSSCNILFNNSNLVALENKFGLFKCINSSNKPNGTYLNNNLNLIILCNKNCSNCLNEKVCLECKDGYFPKNSKCFKKDENCETQTNIGYCDTCKNGVPMNEFKTNKFVCTGSCYTNCTTCLNQNINGCLSCSSGNLYYPSLKECKTNTICDNGYDFIENNNNNCYDICSSKDVNNICISCIINYYLFTDNTCRKCLIGNSVFLNYSMLDLNNKPFCQSCSSECLTCKDNENKCLSCQPNKKYITKLFRCVDNCPTELYYPLNNICEECSNYCITCNSSKCTQCQTGYLIYNKSCLTECPTGYINVEGICIQCLSIINNCNTCSKINNLVVCNDCSDNYYVYKNNCNSCNSIGLYIKNNTCLDCNDNCLSCENESFNCITCKSGFELKLINNYNYCNKFCENNTYLNLDTNNCQSCESCNACYENKVLKCNNCIKCKKICDIELKYTDKGLFINSINLEDKITFNTKYEINNLQYDNIDLINNGIFYKFNNNNLLNLKIKLDLNLINISKNCYNLQTDYNLAREKNTCAIISQEINQDNVLKIKNNFLLKDDFNWKINIFNMTRAGNYTLLNYTKISNLLSELTIKIQANSYKNKTLTELVIDENNIDINSYCLLNIIKTNFTIKTDSKNYKSDFKKIDTQLNEVYLDPNIFNQTQVENVSSKVKNTLKNTANSFILFSSFTGSITIISKLLQLVYIVEFMTLLPINLGIKINTFLKYFKINLNTDINLNKFLKINNDTIKQFYIHKRLVNPKLLELEWIDITIITFETVFIIFLYIFLYLSKFVNNLLSLNQLEINKYKKIQLQTDKLTNIKIKWESKNKINSEKSLNIKKSSKFINKPVHKLNIPKIKYKSQNKSKKQELINQDFHKNYEFKIQILIFNLIEGLRPNIFGILIIYSYTIKDLKFNKENIQIWFLFLINLFFITKYLWDLLTLVFIKPNTSVDKYYLTISYYNINDNKLNIFHQIISSIRDFFLIFIIWTINYQIDIHAIIIAVIQGIYCLFLIFILKSKEKKIDIYKIRFEEICNLFMILSIIFNHYLFQSDVFEYGFIGIYLLLFSYKFIELAYSFLQLIFTGVKTAVKSVAILFHS